MSSIRANITNVYQSGEIVKRQVGIRTELENENSKKVDASHSRKDPSASSSPQQLPHDPKTQLGLPADPNSLAHRVVHTEPSQLEPEETPLPSPDFPKTNQPLSEAQIAFHQEQKSELDLRQARREKVLQESDLAENRARSDANKRSEPAVQSKASSVVEQFMQKLREQAKARRNENNQELLNWEDQQKLSASESIASSDSAKRRNLNNSQNASEELAGRSVTRHQEDQDLYAIRRRIHDDFLNSLQSRTAGSLQSPDSSKGVVAPQAPESQLPAQQEPIAQRPVYEAIEQPYPIDLDEYVKKLTLALIPEMPPDLTDDQPDPGSKVIEHLQREGVFGLSPHGRYQSVNDFIRTKEFEFEMEQRPFTEDEFLLQTETAIYEVLRRGNTSSVAKSLLQAAEAVNSFRNHMIRSSGEDLSAAPASYASQQVPAPQESVHVYESQE